PRRAPETVSNQPPAYSAPPSAVSACVPTTCGSQAIGAPVAGSRAYSELLLTGENPLAYRRPPASASVLAMAEGCQRKDAAAARRGRCRARRGRGGCARGGGGGGRPGGGRGGGSRGGGGGAARRARGAAPPPPPGERGPPPM